MEFRSGAVNKEAGSEQTNRGDLVASSPGRVRGRGAIGGSDEGLAGPVRAPRETHRRRRSQAGPGLADARYPGPDPGNRPHTGGRGTAAHGGTAEAPQDALERTGPGRPRRATGGYQGPAGPGRGQGSVLRNQADHAGGDAGQPAGRFRRNRLLRAEEPGQEQLGRRPHGDRLLRAHAGVRRRAVHSPEHQVGQSRDRQRSGRCDHHEREMEGPAAHRRGRRFAGPVIRRQGDTVRIRQARVLGRKTPVGVHRGEQPAHLQGQRGRLAARAVDRGQLQRFRPVLPARRADRVHLYPHDRPGNRADLPAMLSRQGPAAALPALDEGRRTRHHPAELPRNG